jgi:hypothetical protein
LFQCSNVPREYSGIGKSGAGTRSVFFNTPNFSLDPPKPLAPLNSGTLEQMLFFFFFIYYYYYTYLLYTSTKSSTYDRPLKTQISDFAAFYNFQNLEQLEHWNKLCCSPELYLCPIPTLLSIRLRPNPEPCKRSVLSNTPSSLGQCYERIKYFTKNIKNRQNTGNLSGFELSNYIGRTETFGTSQAY